MFKLVLCIFLKMHFKDIFVQYLLSKNIFHQRSINLKPFLFSCFNIPIFFALWTAYPAFKQLMHFPNYFR